MDPQLTRQFFAGCITASGFTDHFQHIMPLQRAQQRYFLKGSSGSGKSGFIKKIASHMEQAGHHIELFHCANDPTGLDGLAVPALGFSVIDATAPHAHDPAIPKAIDHIIDFAQFLDGGKVSPHLQSLIALAAEKKRLYNQGQKLLGIAKGFYPLDTHDKANVHTMAKDYVKHACGTSPTGVVGLQRHMFLAAITSEGVVNFANRVLSRYAVYGVEGSGGALLHEVAQYALSCGMDVECCYHPLMPQVVAHVILPKAGVAFASVGDPFAYTGTTQEMITMGEAFANPHQEIFDSVVDTAVAAFAKAKQTHSNIEKIYVAAMDFSGVEQCCQSILRAY